MEAMQTRPDKPTNIAELVAWYDKHMQRGASGAACQETVAYPGEFLGVYNFPAVFYLGFLNNHSIHHRGSCRLLRPMGSKCPSIYGGSYDEPFMPPVPRLPRDCDRMKAAKAAFFLGIFEPSAGYSRISIHGTTICAIKAQRG